MQKIYITFCWIFKQTKCILFYLLLVIGISGVAAVLGVLVSLISKTLIDSATSGNHSLLHQSLISLGFTLIIQILLRIANALLSTCCSNKFSNKLQQKLYLHILHSKWQVQNTYHSANIISRLTNDLNTLTTFITSTIPIIVSLGCTFISAFFTLLYLEPTMALIAICISPISVGCAAIVGRKVHIYYNAFQEENIKHRSLFQETLQNIVVEKAFCQEDANLKTLIGIHHNKFKLSLKQTALGVCSSTFLYIGAYLGYFIVFLWGANHLSTGLGSFGTLTALIQLFTNIQSPLNGLAHYFPQLITAYSSSNRLMELENLPLEELKPLPDELKPTISFEHVNFSYTEQLPVLKDITCQLSPGEIIGLIGPSGEGKTTFIRLLLNLIEPITGYIDITHHIKHYPLTASIRDYISYVPQGNTLFSGTIRSNLLQGNPSSTEADLKEALHLACIDDFVFDLELGIDTPIGEKGLGLSEGQAQRLAIARALLRKKPLLILDEATSALDSATEVHLLKTIQSLSYSPTCIIITHRPSTLSICHKVLRLENGILTKLDSSYKVQNSLV